MPDAIKIIQLFNNVQMYDGKGLGILLPLADNRIITQKEL